MSLSMQFWVSIGVQLLLAASVVGMIRQELKDHRGWLKKHDELIDEHGADLTKVRSRVSFIEGQRGLPHGDQ